MGDSPAATSPALGVCAVFGGSGWTGSYLVGQLVGLSRAEGSNVEVHSVDIVPPRCADLAALHEGEHGFHVCDLSDSEAVSGTLRACPRGVDPQHTRTGPLAVLTCPPPTHP